LTKIASSALGASGALFIVWCLVQAGLIPLAAAQEFGDPPYVQTPANVVKAMLDAAKVGPKDFVIDLGSGDGRMAITAAKQYGARGFGVDHDTRLVRFANAKAAEALTAHEFSARVLGDSMQGTIRSDSEKRAISWRARRVAGKTAIGPEVDPKRAEIKAFSGVQ